MHTVVAIIRGGRPHWPMKISSFGDLAARMSEFYERISQNRRVKGC